MDETIGNLNFLKETIGKFKSEIQKFIADPNYSNHNAINLRNTIENLEKNILNKEKNIVGQILNNNKNFFNSVINNKRTVSELPNINTGNNNGYESIGYVRRGKSKLNTNPVSNFSSKHKYFVKFYGDSQDERNEFRDYVMNRRAKDPIHDIILQRKEYNEKKKETYQLFQKYNIIPDRTEKMKNRKPVVNFMDKSKFLKYSNINKNYFKETEYDENNRPIIRKEDMDKGIIHLLNKGLVPKGADLTPAFNKNGHPLNSTNKVKEIYGKKKVKEEVDTLSGFGLGEGIKHEKDEGGLFITLAPDGSNLNGNSFINKSSSNLTNNKATIELDKQDTARSFKSEKEEDGTAYILSQSRHEKSFDKSQKALNDTQKINDEIRAKNAKSTERSQLDTEEDVLHQYHKSLHKMTLLFSGFKLIQNEDYVKFRARNEDKWGLVSYLIEHLQKLFKKLNFSIIEVDGYKLESLAEDEFRTFSVRDFLSCITEKDLIIKGIDVNNHQSIATNIRDIFIIKIQNQIRRFLAYIRAKAIRSKIHNVRRIQAHFRIHKLIKYSKSILSVQFHKNLEKWKIMMEKFKLNWKNIKNGNRVEIHMNSLSFIHHKICTIEKIAEKENNQLSRLIALADPNVEIIYISPYELSDQVLTYYFSILQTFGIENVRERFHIIVPEMKMELPPNFSLSELLLLSNNSLKKIKNIIKGRENCSFIVPGLVSLADLKVSIYLECPILMNDYEMTKALTTKSGGKRVFELTNLAVPISCWDIDSEENFYSSLTLLVKNYITINIWVFKIDNEIQGRGIAYIQLDKIKHFVELKKDKLNNVLGDDSNFESTLRNILRKSVPKKAEIVTSKLYEGWDDFFRHFCNNKGVIEACPTSSFSGITGSPCISMLIEPDGNVHNICTFDKLNVSQFKNFAAISPQKSIPNLNVSLITDKITKYLYEQGVFGYITIEFITFSDTQKNLFWAIDLKFGLNDIISNFKFCEFLYNRSNLQNSVAVIDSNINPPTFFTIPALIHPNIANIKMKDLVYYFRAELLVFDLEKRIGIVFNLPDILQCGMLGISGIYTCTYNYDIWKLIDNSLNLLKSLIFPKDFKPILQDEKRTDLIDINEIFSRMKILYKHISKE